MSGASQPARLSFEEESTVIPGDGVERTVPTDVLFRIIEGTFRLDAALAAVAKMTFFSETAPASGIFIEIPTQTPVNTDAFMIPFCFTVAAGCKYKFVKNGTGSTEEIFANTYRERDVSGA